MIKTKYLNELEISDTCQVGSKGKEVRKIQEWLNIQAYLNPQATLATGIDGSYGPGTKASIESFQRLKGLSVTGAVNSSVFAALCEPPMIFARRRPTPCARLFVRLPRLTSKLAQLS